MDSEINNGGSAFPVECSWNNVTKTFDGLQTGNTSGWRTGMTLRDYFAAKSLQGMLASGHQAALEKTTIASGGSPCLGVALAAYGFADAMLRAREPVPNPQQGER